MDKHKIALRAYKRGDYQEAFKLWEEASFDKNDQALTNLGMMYLKGEGVKKDLQKARSYFEAGADLGNPSSQFNLGVMYCSAIGVTEDMKMGLDYLDKAAGKDHPNANFRLALHYSQERSSIDTLKISFHHMLKAANLGHAMAKIRLMGIDYPEADDVEPLNEKYREKSFGEKILVVQDALDRYIRPMLQKDGGDIVLLDYIDFNKPEIRLSYMGNCAGCSLASSSTYLLIRQTFENVIDKHIKVYII